MDTKTFANFKEAFKSFVNNDKDYIFTRHSLDRGEKIEPHFHPEANEWVVINHGKFTVKLENHEETLDLKRRVTVLYFPKGQKHSFTIHSKISYFVFKDKSDKTINYEHPGPARQNGLEG